MSDRIGENIYHFRTQMHMKQSELAEKLGVTVQAVSRWENGGTPDISLLPALSDALNVSIDALFGRDETQYEDPLNGLAAKIRSLPEEERYHAAYHASLRIMLAISDSPSIDQLFSDPRKVENNRQAVKIIGQVRDGFLCGSLLKKRNYLFACASSEESGLLSPDQYRSIFECLSHSSVLSAVLFFLHQKNETGCTLSFIMKETGLDRSEASAALKELHDSGLAETGTYLSETGEIETWHLNNPCLIMAVLLIMADFSDPENSDTVNLTLKKEDGIKPLINRSTDH